MFYEPENLDWRFEAKCYNDQYLQDQLKMVRKYGAEDPFFPDKGKGGSQSQWAKRYCSDCPVRLACLAEAMKSLDLEVVNHYQGIWGGLSQQTRRSLKKKQQAKNQQILQQVQELFPDAENTHTSDEEDGMDEILPPAS